MPSREEVDLFAKTLLVPTPPSLLLFTLGIVHIVRQSKRLRETANHSKLAQAEAVCTFAEETLLDLITMFAASLAINWLYRRGFKPLAWFCVALPILLIVLVVVLFIQTRRNKQKK